MRPGDWADRAACHGDPRFTDPPRRGTADLAAVCGRCPVAGDCRDYAAGHQWQGVLIAGWVAPSHDKTRPPWAAR